MKLAQPLRLRLDITISANGKSEADTFLWLCNKRLVERSLLEIYGDGTDIVLLEQGPVAACDNK